ncbi:electron transport complex subunit RsxG [Vibrio salinus]|uniref:electron transport complex subunit RsxG n=1 Tax=Vibrio salinus TaxID=2899784 RepID=UPI001E339DD9|nr:electron transport complex subunit RsxG [Vibrio salinus]MCE0492967.1 electron transport complex subunit RsxG [Vibrio salinus]
MLNAIKKNGLILAIFACVSTGLVAITQYLTQDQITHQERKQLLSVLSQVIPENAYNNDLYKACTLVSLPYLKNAPMVHAYIAKKDGTINGMAIESIAPDGYNGKIKLIIGINNRGIITGTRVLSQNETPGLGDKIDLRVSNWILNFTGKYLTPENESTWHVRKDGGQFDQFTGATITPRAVVKAVKHTLEFVHAKRDDIYAQPFNCSEGEK